MRVQLLDHEDWARWPHETVRIETRYSDIKPEVSLRVPTPPAFAAMKTLARTDRHAARDLYDLARLAELGALTREAAELVRDATGASVQKYEFARLPTGLEWQAQLAHRTRDLPGPERCLDLVRNAYGQALGWWLPRLHSRVGNGRGSITCFITIVEVSPRTPGSLASVSSYSRWYDARSAVTTRSR